VSALGDATPGDVIANTSERTFWLLSENEPDCDRWHEWRSDSIALVVGADLTEHNKVLELTLLAAGSAQPAWVELVDGFDVVAGASRG